MVISINNYKYDNKGVNYPSSIPFPTSVCKYYSLSSNSLDAFLKGYLFGSHPLQLNDIRDSHYDLIKFSESPNKLFYNKFKHYDNNQFKELSLDDKKKFFWIKETSLLGIISLTTTDNNDLMWPHYTQENGFMIKFNTEKLLENICANKDCKILEFAPINYVSEVYQIAINPNKINEIQGITYYLTNIKNNKWKYENEWRILVSKDGMCPPSHDFYSNYSKRNCCKDRKFSYSSEKCIEQIVWGNNFITSRSISKSEDNEGWISLKLLCKNKTLYNTLKIIATLHYDKFYISVLRKDKSNTNTKLVRCNQRYEIKMKDKNVLIKGTLEYK